MGIETKVIDIINRVANEKFWKLECAKGYYSHHLYVNSPHETSDSCGNCDGASCDSCSWVKVPAHFACGIPYDVLFQWLLEENVPEDNISRLINNHIIDGYQLVWPTETMLKETHPELYAALTTPDQEFLGVVKSYHGKFEVVAQLFNAILDHYNLKNADRWSGHIPNQLDKYWADCKYDHKVACGNA